MAETMLLGLFAETPLHPGSGQAAGVVDLPVAREGATGLPHIPDSGLKGALRQWAEERGDLDDKLLFGMPDAEAGSEGAAAAVGAGLLLISTARLLFLPVRRLDGPYAWVTTPYLLERLGRDLKRARCGSVDVPRSRPFADDQLLMASPPTNGPIYLEEYAFSPGTLEDTAKAALVAITGQLVADKQVAGRIGAQIAVMTDEEFAWFVANALPVDARNRLDDNKISESLWYEETLPPDTLLYATIGARRSDPAATGAVGAFRDALLDDGYLRAGGNETVGQGWMRVTVLGGNDGQA